MHGLGEIKYGLIAAARDAFISWRSISPNWIIVNRHETIGDVSYDEGANNQRDWKDKCIITSYHAE